MFYFTYVFFFPSIYKWSITQNIRTGLPSDFLITISVFFIEKPDIFFWCYLMCQNCPSSSFLCLLESPAEINPEDCKITGSTCRHTVFPRRYLLSDMNVGCDHTDLFPDAKSDCLCHTLLTTHFFAFGDALQTSSLKLSELGKKKKKQSALSPYLFIPHPPHTHTFGVYVCMCLFCPLFLIFE